MKVKKLFHHGQRMLRGYELRESVSKLLSISIPKANLHSSREGVADVFNRLDREGFADLPAMLSEKEIDDIFEFLHGKLVSSPYIKNQAPFDPNTPPPSTNIGAYSDEVLVNCPHILRAANSPFLLEILFRHFGCKPTLSKISIWHSFPNENSAQNAENYHRDVDDIKFVKVFVYLTDVDEGGGPHVYVKGSHKKNTMLKIRRYDDAEVEAEFPEDRIMTITGKRGASFIENTYGLHKGLKAQTSRRTLLQFEYSLFPISAYSYDHKFSKFEDSVDQYVSRMYL